MIWKSAVVVLALGVLGSAALGQQGNGQQNGQGNGRLQQRLDNLQQRLQQRGIDLNQVQQNFQQALQAQGIDPAQLQQRLADRLQQAGIDPTQLQQQLQQAGMGQGGLLGLGGVTATFADQTTEMELVLTDLTDEQKAQLKDKVAAAQAATNDFRTRSNARLQELQQTGDQLAVQDGREALQKDALALQFKNTQDVENVLTPEQKNTWEAYMLAKLIKQKLVAAVLTPEQTDKVEAIVKDAGKDIVAAPDAETKNKVDGAVYRRVLEEVVTEDQFGVLVGAAR